MQNIRNGNWKTDQLINVVAFAVFFFFDGIMCALHLFVCFFIFLFVILYMPFENESNLKPLQRRLAKFRFTVAMRRIPCIQFSFIRVCLFANTKSMHTGSYNIHTYIRTGDPLSIQLKEKSHVQTSCSPSSILCVACCIHC